MRKDILKLLGISMVAVLVSVISYSCGSSSSGGGGSSKPTVSVTLTPTSGTIGAVNLNSMLYEDISASIGSAAGTVDPSTITVSISPTLTFTTANGFNAGSFANYVDIVPTGFLPKGQTYSVTTSFTAKINNTNYPITAYNTFTTVSSAGTATALPGWSYIVTVNNVLQPSGLGSVLSGNIPTLAISIITGTVSSNPTASKADGSMILFGGKAAGAAPADITTDFALPFAATYTGDEFMSFGSASLSVSGISVPLQNFNLSGTANADGTISNGVLYGVVHCTDASCSNLGTTVGSIVSQYIDANGNMIVLGTFTGAKNAFVPVAWIGGSDTANSNLINGGGAITTATIDVTTTTSPLLSTATFPFVILTTTDANNMLSMVATGQGGSYAKTSPVTINYPLVEPGLALTPFTTTTGVAYTAQFMFGLTDSKTVTFTP